MLRTWEKRMQQQLQDSVLGGGRSGFWLSSRLHPLKGWRSQLWLKRDDELSFYGSKWRKLHGLASAMREEKADTVLAWGGSRSQHLLGLAQLSRELDLELRLLVKEGSPRQAQGPDLLWPLLVPAAAVETIPRAAWPEVAALAQKRYEALTLAGQRVFRVREGGAQIEALWGALTLPWDIVQQEKQLGLEFDRILVDAGTGLTAQALIIGLGLLQHKAHCEVLLCAGDAADFQRDLELRRQELAAQLGHDITLAGFQCYQPRVARSFGSTNRAVFTAIAEAAAQHGVLLDPIYSAKLWMHARLQEAAWGIDDKVLMIHSGGAASLFGFPERLQAFKF